MLIDEATCSLCFKAASFVNRTSAGIAQPQLYFPFCLIRLAELQPSRQEDTLLSVNLKKIDKTLQLKDSIIQQGKVYSTDKTTMKIPGNHPSFWQASRKLVFILSSQLFIASCKAAPAHSQCIRQSVWAEWDKDARRISARIDRGDTLSPRCPISCSLGTEVRVGGDHWVAAFWQILYTASQLRWCLFKCKGSTRLADSAAIRALEWTGGEMAHKHALVLTGTLHVCWR